MKKKILYFFATIFAFIFAFTLASCGDDVVEKLQNDYGIVIEGDNFNSNIQISYQNVTDDEVISNIESALINQEYNKNAVIRIFDVSLLLDGKKIQPSKEVSVTIPTKDLYVDVLKEYVLFHIKDDNQIEVLNFTLASDTLKFSVSSFSYFVLAQKQKEVKTYTITWKNYDGTILEEDKNVEEGSMPKYDGDNPSREEDDNYVYTFNGWTPELVMVGGDATYTATYLASQKENHVHDYGAYYYAKPATFFEDGNIKYYYCEECGKYFDEDYNEVESVIIPKLSSDVVLLVNGTKVGDFSTTKVEESCIEWNLSNIELKKDDILTIAAKDNTSIIYPYYPDTTTNVTEENTVHNDVASATLHIIGTPNGLTLSVSGFEYDGFVLKVTYAENDEVIEYPMNLVEYDFGTPTRSYVYGYLDYSIGDKFVIEDHDNDVTYDYSNVEEADLWKEFIFSYNENNEIVINKLIKLGVEFKLDTNEILIDPIYSPNTQASYFLELKGETEKVNMDETIVEVDSSDYEELTYVINHETTINNEETKSAISNGYALYTYTTALPANAEIRIFDGTNYIPNDHLLDVFGVDNVLEYGEFTTDGYLKIKKAGTYVIMYHPCIDSYTISLGNTIPTGYSYMTGGLTYDVVPDSNGLITISDFEATAYTSITFLNGTNIISDVTLDSSVSATTAMCTSGSIMLINAGKYDIVLNTSTKKVFITDKTPASIVGGMIMNLGTYSTKTFVINPSNSNEAYVSGYVVSDTSKYHSIRDSKSDSVDDITIAQDSTDYVQLLGSFLQFKQIGTYSVYINIDTHVVRVELEGGAVINTIVPKSLYFSASEIYTLVENSENTNELCYLNLVLTAYVSDFKVRGDNGSNLTDVKLAEGTTGIVTNGTSISCTTSGTYNFYINKETHEVRIIIVS